ncbi:MAG: nickel import ATP-binding protein NikE [Dethiosulfovibrio peptidovorans]|nr:MAG: nickel import ATP-binding protein NikE [Dethiosulfovibrio peptidovorans]
MSALLSVRDLHRIYRRGGFFTHAEELHVLQGIDLDLEEGSTLGLVGQSGCGKSTLGRMILGIERPSCGTVCFRGTDIRTMAADEFREFRRNVQVVFQNVHNSVNPRMTAGEIVAEPLRNFLNISKKEAIRRSRPLLEQVGLKASDADKLPGQFSGGELQRVCIARALAPDPEVIVFDEAVSSLDMLIQTRILSLIKDIRRERGLSALFISHDLRVVADLCDEVALIKDGVIVLRERSIADLASSGDSAVREMVNSLPPATPIR